MQHQYKATTETGQAMFLGDGPLIRNGVRGVVRWGDDPRAAWEGNLQVGRLAEATAKRSANAMLRRLVYHFNRSGKRWEVEQREERDRKERERRAARDRRIRIERAALDYHEAAGLLLACLAENEAGMFFVTGGMNANYNTAIRALRAASGKAEGRGA
jgi:hypothetical protein